MPISTATTGAWAIAAVVSIGVLVAGIVLFALFGHTFWHESRPVVKPATSGPFVGVLYVFDGFKDIELARSIAALGGAVWYAAPKQPVTPNPKVSLLVVQQPSVSQDKNDQARQQGFDHAIPVLSLRDCVMSPPTETQPAMGVSESFSGGPKLESRIVR